MTYQISFEKFNLFNGDGLDRAAAMSEISVSKRASWGAPGFSSVRRVFDDVSNVRVRDLVPEKLIVSGVERDSGETLSVLFSGPDRALDYCAGAIFGSQSYVVDRVRKHRVTLPDIVVNIRHANKFRKDIPCGVRAPQWVGQELELKDNWSDTIAALPNRLRKEIARTQRKHRYRVTMSSGLDAISKFKTELLNPSLQTRYGRGAILARDCQFVKQCRDMFRLDLLYQDKVVGASLLDHQGDRLAIRKSAICPNMDELRGRADVLDYFCLLTAQLLKCDVLDFGLSRAHLEDGTFRYKAKWGTRIVPLNGLKADVCITPCRYTTAVRAFLRRCYYLQRGGEGGFKIRVLCETDVPPVKDWPLWRLADIEGINCIELVGQLESTLIDVPSAWSGRVKFSSVNLPDYSANVSGDKR